MDLYLYLKEHRFVDAWVNGGRVPFYVASTYKKEERKGIYTPDENLIDNSTFDINLLGGVINFGGTCKEIKIINFEAEGRSVNGTVNRHYEDGLVVCLSTKRSKFIARKLGKTACVKITEIGRLKKLIDESTAIFGRQGLCKYTASHKRHHFLKSTYDSWQEEYRLFWPGVENIDVDIPPGMAELSFYLPES